MRQGQVHRDSSESYLVGTIKLFYVCTLTDDKGIQRKEVFVAVRKRPIIDRDRSLYIVNTVSTDTNQPVFKYEFDVSTDIILHLDSITDRLMLVPHYDKDHADTLMCGIVMWAAR